ncbi:MAG: alpha/beta hydrolase, partial [Rhizobiales bacterium]|nr:alpha/beta hydrolase [Hyphomicrobiales bacterium]
MTRRGLLLAGAASLLAARAGAAPLTGERMTLVPFVHAPFPYEGIVPRKDVPFLDAADGARRGHVARDGATYWQDVTYSDRRSLVFVPAGFDPDRPITLVVYFHGNFATLERDVVGRQRLPAQVAASGLNAVLLAPQLAVDAPDSSSGNFWTPGYFATYLDEASARIAEALGLPSLAGKLATAPVVIVAYSGGYNPAAYAVGVGGADDRIAGLILIDALYAEEDRIADWI